jgi:4-carboxymuconolactone decarboxylase
MPRLPLAEPSPGSDPAPLKLFRMVAHAETAYGPWLGYGGALLTQLELDPLLRELAILQVARQVGSQYEWVQHDPISRAVGATGEQIDAIQAGRDDDPAFDADQSLVLRLTRTTVNEGAASEEQIAEAKERLGARQVVELLLVIGNYTAIAMLIASTGLEPDAPLDPDQLTRARDTADQPISGGGPGA